MSKKAQTHSHDSNVQPVSVSSAAPHDETGLLHERSQQFDDLLRMLPDLVFGVNANRQITFMNDALRKYVGLEQEGTGSEFADWTVDTLVRHDPIFDLVSARLAETSSGEAASTTPKTSEIRSDARKRDFQVTIAKTDYGHVVVMRDISSQRELGKFKDEVLKLASHDLRSPLALIIGYASLIAIDLPQDSPVQEYVNSILHATERMTGLLDALMTVEQLRNAPLELNREVKFEDIVRDAVENARAQTKLRNQTIEMEMTLAEIPMITINRSLVREVIENLLGNASKYSAEGKTIKLSSWFDADRVYVSVCDEGMGVSAEQLPRIFEAFYRGKQPSGQKSDGRGLGLYIVKTVAQRHYGDVWVESEVGKGSIFGFWLPLVQKNY